MRDGVKHDEAAFRHQLLELLVCDVRGKLGDIDMGRLFRVHVEPGCGNSSISTDYKN